ncbi:MAG: hypothetical protein FWB74_03450 [Defluviitaleaceae bacterium]|nr:hypothetical protein [Defluviitaleaceae bacterium]
MKKLLTGLVFVLCLVALAGCARYFPDEPYTPEYSPPYTDIAAYDCEDCEEDTYQGLGARILFELPVFDDEYYDYEYYYEEIYQYEYEYTEHTTPVAVVTTTPAPYVPVATIYIPEVTEPMAQYNFIGNINSLIFHLPTCETLPAYHNRIYFVKRDDALHAGHRACLRCQP